MCVVTGTGNEAELVCGNAPAITGSYTAYNGADLGSLNNGSSPNGTWQLIAQDFAAGDVGQITNWSLTFGTLLTTTQTAGLVSGSTFPLGTTTNTFEVEDVFGNTADCSFDVIVTDNELPTVTCPTDVTVAPDAGLCTASGVNLGTPTSGDNCGVATTTNDAPLTFATGNTTVTWTVTDNSGNTATCTQTVTVTGGGVLTITCPADISLTTDAGVCTTSGASLGSPIVSGGCGGTTVTNDAPALFPLGSTTVTWTVTDNANNTATCTQIVTVTDDELPTIACPADVNATTDAGVCTATVSLGTATTADNCGVASTTNDAPASFPLGSTTVTWTVTDNSGNTATCAQTVTVTDAELPTIICPADVTVNTDAGICSASGIVLGNEVTGDNCGVASTTNDAPSTFNLGATTVTWTVTDNSGNTATCTQVVTVADVEVPTIVCPADLALNTDAGVCTASGASLGNASANDNCGVSSLTNDAPANFPVGVTTVTWTAADASGNTATCTQTVTVTDAELPIVTCPADINTTTDAGVCIATVNLGNPTSSDNCGVASTTNDAPASFGIGTTTVPGREQM